MIASVWSALADPWHQELLRRAALEVVLVGLAAGALGCWVVLGDLAYGAESLAHGLLPGLVGAALLGLPLVAGGATGIVAAALGVAVAARTPAVGRDAAIAVVVTAFLGLGALLALSPASPPRVQELLFGDVLGVTGTDLVVAGVLAAVVLGVLRLAHGRLLVAGFDRPSAPALGASPALADATVLVLLALTVLVAVQSLGNLLVVAVLVAPAAAARRHARRFGPMMALAAALAVLAGIGGLYLSFYAGTAAGASIALLCVVLWLAARALPSRA